MHDCFLYDYSLQDWDIAMRVNMGGGLEFKKYLWKHEAKTMKDCAEEFLKAPLWNDCFEIGRFSPKIITGQSITRPYCSLGNKMENKTTGVLLILRLL